MCDVNTIDEVDDITGEATQVAIQKLRELFLKEAKENEDKYYESDVNRMTEDDYFCYRFIRHRTGDVKKAFKMAKDSLRWRKEFAVNDIKESNIHSLCFEGKGLYTYGKDNTGRENLIMIVKLIRTDAEAVVELYKFFIYWLELIEKRDEQKGFTLIMNCKDAGISNVAMNMIRFFINVLNTYYPYFSKRIVVLDLPLILVATWKIIKMLVPKEHIDVIKFVDKVSILEFIDASELPVSMGGTNTYEYSYVPSEAVNA